MKTFSKLSILLLLSCASSPALAATVRLPVCLQYPDSNAAVPCTGVVPVDSTTGNPLSWQTLFASGGSGGGSSSSGLSSVGTVGSAAGGYANQTGYVGADGNLHNWVGDNTGHPAVSIFGVSSVTVSGALPSGTNTIGAISNTSFGVSSLPALPAGSNTIGSIANTTFGATQSGTWNVGVTGSVAVTGAFYQATQPVSGTISIANFPATQTVAGSVSVSNFPSTQAVTLSGTPAVSVSNFPSTQTVSGSVNVTGTAAVNLTQVSGTALTLGATTQSAALPVALSTDGPVGQKTDAAATTTDATATSLIAQVKQTNVKLGSPLQAGGSVSISNFPATQAVSGSVSLSGTSAVNLGQVGGTTLSLGATTQSSAIPVALSTDGPVGLKTDAPAITTDTTSTSLIAQVKQTNVIGGQIKSALGTPLQAGGAVSVSNFPATQTITGSVDTVVKASSTSRSAVIGFTGTANAATSASTTLVVNTTSNFTSQTSILSGIPIVGQIVSGTGITTGTTITAVSPVSATQYTLTLSAAATVSSGVTISSLGPQTIMLANASRRGFSVQNQGTGTCYINGSGAATIGPDSLLIASLSYYETKDSHAAPGAISEICTAAATGSYAREW